MVFTCAEDRLWSEAILTWLAERWPDRYAGWTPNTLVAALKPYGVRPVQVWATDPTPAKNATDAATPSTHSHTVDGKVTKRTASDRLAR